MAFYDSETLFVFIVSFHLPLKLLLINYLKKKRKKKMRGYPQFIFWDSNSHWKFLLFLYSHKLRKSNFVL